MNISVETEIGQRKKRQVVFTGTILPPTSAKHGSMEHCCEGALRVQTAMFLLLTAAQSLRQAKWATYAKLCKDYRYVWVRSVCRCATACLPLYTTEHGDGIDGRPNLTGTCVCVCVCVDE